MITLIKIRELDLAAPAGVGRPRYLSAASGLVSIGTHLYIVADDELHLGVFPLQSTDAGHRCGSSREHCRWLLRSARRASPPGSIDCASTLSTILSWRPLCARLRLNAPASHGCPGRARPTGRNARRAVLCDLSNLFASLAAHFAALNIEGAVVVGDELCLLQRGGSRDAQNAMIFFRLSSVLEAFQFGGAIAPSALHAFELGDVDGIPLSFTDCAALPGGAVVFSAVAEDTPDHYQDGPCAGAAIGIATRAGTLACLERLEGCHKIEGIDAKVHNDIIRLLLVTDADDINIPAGLFSATISTKESGQLHCDPV